MVRAWWLGSLLWLFIISSISDRNSWVSFKLRKVIHIIIRRAWLHVASLGLVILTNHYCWWGMLLKFNYGVGRRPWGCRTLDSLLFSPSRVSANCGRGAAVHHCCWFGTIKVRGWWFAHGFNFIETLWISAAHCKREARNNVCSSLVSIRVYSPVCLRAWTYLDLLCRPRLGADWSLSCWKDDLDTWISSKLIFLQAIGVSLRTRALEHKISHDVPCRFAKNRFCAVSFSWIALSLRNVTSVAVSGWIRSKLAHWSHRSYWIPNSCSWLSLQEFVADLIAARPCLKLIFVSCLYHLV